MKIIDRYIIRTFAVPWIYCLLAFTMVFIIQDLFSNMNDFVDYKVPFLTVLFFYLCLLPSLMVFIVPIALLMATLYSLYQLTHNNELTAMRASGLSLYRLVTPYILIGLCSTGFVLVINETIGPWSAYYTTMFMKEKGQKEGELSPYIKSVNFRNVTANRLWEIEQFNSRSPTYEMTGVTLTQERDSGKNEYIIMAERAEYLDGRWTMYNFSRQAFDEDGYQTVTFDKDGVQLRADDVLAWMEMPHLKESPNIFISDMKERAFMSFTQLKNYLIHHPGVSSKTKAEIGTNMHMRLAMPFICMVAIMLGIPFGTHTARKGAMLGITVCIAMFITYYILMNLLKAMGHSEQISPFLAAWGPNLTFLGIGFTLLYRMR
ncbi:MAG: lipopolysaccharide export system permease protein [Kiritimatiellia bacterium]|jgi:lipopolysaccharide export system permease protein